MFHIFIKLSSPALIITVLYLNSSHNFKQFIDFPWAFFLQVTYFPQINKHMSPLELPVIMSDSMLFPYTLDVYTIHVIYELALSWASYFFIKVRLLTPIIQRDLVPHKAISLKLYGLNFKSKKQVSSMNLKHIIYSLTQLYISTDCW